MTLDLEGVHNKQNKAFCNNKLFFESSSHRSGVRGQMYCTEIDLHACAKSRQQRPGPLSFYNAYLKYDMHVISNKHQQNKAFCNKTAETAGRLSGNGLGLRFCFGLATVCICFLTGRFCANFLFILRAYSHFHAQV